MTIKRIPYEAVMSSDIPSPNKSDPKAAAIVSPFEDSRYFRVSVFEKNSLGDLEAAVMDDEKRELLPGYLYGMSFEESDNYIDDGPVIFLNKLCDLLWDKETGWLKDKVQSLLRAPKADLYIPEEYADIQITKVSMGGMAAKSVRKWEFDLPCGDKLLRMPAGAADLKSASGGYKISVPRDAPRIFYDGKKKVKLSLDEIIEKFSCVGVTVKKRGCL